MAVSGVYASGVGGGGAGSDCAGVYRSSASVYGMAAFHHHPQLHHHHHAAHPAAWLAPYATLIPPAHPAHHAAHPAHPAHIPIDTVPSQYVSTFNIYRVFSRIIQRKHADLLNRRWYNMG